MKLHKMNMSLLLTTLVAMALLASACQRAVPAPGATAPATETNATAAPVAAAPSAPAGTANVVYNLPDLDGRKILAAVANDYTPLQYVDPDTGEAVGWEYDAVEELCRRLNCVVDWQTTSWDAMIPAIADGQFDVGMDGITITDERAQQVDFSAPYMTSQQFMLVRADEDRFATPAEFGSRRGSADRCTGRHDRLLHRSLRHPGRRRSQPARQAVRQLRLVGAGADRR